MSIKKDNLNHLMDKASFKFSQRPGPHSKYNNFVIESVTTHKRKKNHHTNKNKAIESKLYRHVI